MYVETSVAKQNDVYYYVEISVAREGLASLTLISMNS